MHEIYPMQHGNTIDVHKSINRTITDRNTDIPILSLLAYNQQAMILDLAEKTHKCHQL